MKTFRKEISIYLVIGFGILSLTSCATYDLGVGATLPPSTQKPGVGTDIDVPPTTGNVDPSAAILKSTLTGPSTIALEWEHDISVEYYTVYSRAAGTANFVSENHQLESNIREYGFAAVPGINYEFVIRSYLNDRHMDSNILSALTNESEAPLIAPNTPSVDSIENQMCELSFNFMDTSKNEARYIVEIEWRTRKWLFIPSEGNGEWIMDPKSDTLEFTAGPYQKLNFNEIRSLTHENTVVRATDNRTNTLAPIPDNFKFRVKASNNIGDSEFSQWSEEINLPSSCF